jgi:hypothetical protein
MQSLLFGVEPFEEVGVCGWKLEQVEHVLLMGSLKIKRFSFKQAQSRSR